MWKTSSDQAIVKTAKLLACQISGCLNNTYIWKKDGSIGYGYLYNPELYHCIINKAWMIIEQNIEYISKELKLKVVFSNTDSIGFEVNDQDEG